MERNVSLFRNGRNQAVRIPRGFELPGDTAVMRKEGDSLIISPAPKRSILAELRKMEPLDPSDWMDPIEDLPPDGVEV